MTRIHPLQSHLKNIVILLLFLLGIAAGVFATTPGSAQNILPPPVEQLDSSLAPAWTQIVENRPNRQIFRQGDVEYTNVIFRGRPLFPVAARINVGDSNATDASPAEWRANIVENNLATILNVGFNPDTFEVKVSTLDNLKVIIVSDAPRINEDVIVTITAPDARLAQMPVPLLAEDRAETIRAALVAAWQEIQPEARRQQRHRALQIAIAAIAATSILWIVKRWLKRHYKRLDGDDSPIAETETPSMPLLPESGDRERSERLNTQLLRKQQLYLNLSLQQFLQLGQAVIWIWSIAAVLELFPETRIWASWVRSFPSQILTIAIVMFGLAKLAQEILSRTIHKKLDEFRLLDEDRYARALLRAPTLKEVFSSIINTTAAITGVIGFLLWQRIDLSEALTGAGIFGAALGLVFQNLLKDWLNGMFILMEDRYAVGDVVEINGIVGFVERMSFRTTQVRSDGGRLTTIPHNQIEIVHNLTKDWSRIDLAVEIAHPANPTEAIAMMKQVATQMQNSPEWQEDILDPAVLIGVSKISATGTQIVMWIQTKRMRQWDVEREFWRRLKEAFDRQGIEIGMPRQNVLLTSSSHPIKDYGGRAPERTNDA
ncbi:MAG: mechanosensitive ion channel family protein [Spirulina sp.]